MDHDDILHLEAQEFLRQASDEMLELATLQEIDLNALAHCELRARNSSRQQQQHDHQRHRAGVYDALKTQEHYAGFSDLIGALVLN